FRVIDKTVALLERLAAERPVVIVFEDLHWADPSTLRAIRAISRALSRLPVALLSTLRPFPERPELVRAIDELLRRGATQLTLRALDDPAVSALAEAVADAPPGATLSGQLSWAAGNPLFVIELVKALSEQGSLAVREGRADVCDLSLPRTLPLTILRRMSFLPPETLELLKVAAVLGRVFSVAELAAVTARNQIELLPALKAALRAGLLEDSPAGLAFRHELMREALYHDLAVPLRQAFHREAARALTVAGIPAVRLAEHLFLGACTSDPESIQWLRRAAAQAAPRSPAVAVKLCQRAFELTLTDDPDRNAVAAELAPLLLQTGRSEEAERVAREVLARGPTVAIEVALRRALGELLWSAGWRNAAIAELEAAARVPGASDRDRAGSLALAANIRVFIGDPQGAAAQARQAQTLRPGDEFVSCLAAQTLALAAQARGGIVDAVELAQRAVEIAARSRDPRVGHLHPHLHLGLVLLDVDRRDDALAAIQLGLSLSEERGHLLWLPLHHAVLALFRAVGGELADALAEVEAGLMLTDEIGTRLHSPLLRGTAGLVTLHQGDLVAAQAHLVEASEECTASANADFQLAAPVGDTTRKGIRWPKEWGQWVLAMVFEAQGQTGQAWELMEEAWQSAAPLRFSLSYRFLGPDLIRLAAAAGDRERAAAVAREVADGAPRAASLGATAAVLRCQGLVRDDPAMLLAAVQTYRQLPPTLELALTCEDAGAALCRTGRVAEAAPVLDEALDFYLRNGARRRAARVEAALRPLGVRRGRVGRARRKTVGWASLTASELDVARLAAQGLTNRQIGDRLFISRRTAETHLAHVFAKLEINSRAQLAAEVARRESTP
ncbi:MAG TPA: LuxR C-terminal-related transcriptional regulator, partial [Pseudonocardiaceae bacterium]|nr:LuxR C-terminal-related transcriptional regulator [Pseudonocardiaceae bacterium]